ncbi:hypothetical protein CONPUDRAFT_52948 [Coniophora puteana RWD-64-598 SS2]|uniref:CCHC-type domain-containing protein n=1 Tax=Coniophora puteana (strain RWD-64-598) TaxID=741705 RepID=A0A5M3MVC4_CONPW|nr:uncharacterized protein CONPUDRAFT_52948 [Coniophora puteana RWD-64-598 SS2]EIW83099.1 hypothetical protein CONPUDRAFT_52948 [Coniophora puteana RWD-64-598 SS2]
MILPVSILNHYDCIVAQLRLDRSEARRQQRITQKFQDTTCFACRQKGHAAKDCPDTKADGTEQKHSGKVVGICYRCGSTRHNLSRCKEPEDPLIPLPFASCFVCSGKGHLASLCPKNKERGVYPNGGCCKLCGSTAHLAKDCELRKGDTRTSTSVVGLTKNVGADEDDFHVLKRRTAEVDKDEKRIEKIKRAVVDGVGVQSGIKVSGAPKPGAAKKVVQF